MMEPLHGLSVDYVPISSLRSNPRNARVHTPRQVRQIGRSLEAFGFNVPVLIDATNNIVAGHGRVLAAKQRLARSARDPPRTPKRGTGTGLRDR